MKKQAAKVVWVLALGLMNAVACGDETGHVEFGVNDFLGNLGRSEILAPMIRPSAEDRTHYLDALRDAGVTAVRETFMNWADIEPVRGQRYNLAPYDDIARKASERGIEIIALAYPFPDWATGAAPRAPDAPFHTMYALPRREFEADFRKLVSTFVYRYSGQHPDSLKLALPVRRWIFSNELDHFKVDPNEYAFWQRVFWEEVKRADPDATVVSMGFSHPAQHWQFLQDVLDSPALKGEHYPYFDALAFHSYPEIYEPNLYLMNAGAGYLRESMKKRGISVPLWLMETGDNSQDESRQAYRDIRSLLHGASIGAVRVHLHGTWDFGHGQNWGLLAEAPSGEVPRRKQSFRAVKTFLELTKDNRGVEFLGPGRYRVKLADGRFMYALWTEAANQDARGLFRDDDRLDVRSLSGARKEAQGKDLALSEEPLFVTIMK